MKLTSRSTCDWASTSLFLSEWSWSPDAGSTSKSDSKKLSASGWSNAHTVYHHSCRTPLFIYQHTPFKSQNNTLKMKYSLVSTTDCKFIYMMIIQWPKHRLYCRRSISKCLSIQSANTAPSCLRKWTNISSHDWVKTEEGRLNSQIIITHIYISPFKKPVYLVVWTRTSLLSRFK